MDVLVMVEESRSQSVVLAHVDSVASPMERGHQQPRDVVTFYGQLTAESLALVLAAVVEGHRAVEGVTGAIRHMGIWDGEGARGDASWRDGESGQLMSRDVEIPLDKLTATSRELLAEFGQGIRRLVAGLLMPDWPEGSKRAINFNMTSAPAYGVSAASAETMLDKFREAQALAFDTEGD